jgi:hypothetical protein
MLTWRIAEAFQEFRGADADEQWVKWSDVAAVLDTEGEPVATRLSVEDEARESFLRGHLDTEGDRPQEEKEEKALSRVDQSTHVPSTGSTANTTPEPRSMFTQNLDGDWVCEHGTASDIHCCGCHSGFIFDRTKCTCGVA